MRLNAVRTFTMVILFSVTAVIPAFAGTGTVRLAWDANTEGDLAGYVIDYGTTPGLYPNSSNVGLVTEASVGGLTPGVKYYFAVRAYNTAGVYSARSTEVTYTPPILTPGVPGVTELFWQHGTSGSLSTWVLQGTTQVAVSSLQPAQIDPAWSIAGVGDFNGDARRDIVWRHQDGWIAAWTMNGATMVSGDLLRPDRVVDTNWRIVAVADLNLDGRSDLIWHHGATGEVSVWHMNGLSLLDGRLLEPSRVADVDWRIVGSGDFNADGRPDLLWYHRTQGVLAVWFLNGTRQISGSLLTAPGVADLSWKPVTVQDLDGDGDPDIVWQHAQGHLAAWILSGTTLLSGGPLVPGQVADVEWRIKAGR